MQCPLSVPGGESVLIAHVTGRYRGQVTAGTAAHIRECEACANRVRSQNTLWQALDEWQSPAVSLDFEQNVLVRVAELKSKPERWWVVANRSLTGLLTRPAAALSFGAMVLVVGAALVNLPRSPTLMPAAGMQDGGATVIQTVTPRDAEQLDKTFDDLQLLQQLDAKDEGSVDSHPI